MANAEIVKLADRIKDFKKLYDEFELVVAKKASVDHLLYKYVYPAQIIFTELTFYILEINRHFNGAYFYAERTCFEELLKIGWHIFHQFKKAGGVNDFKYCPDFPAPWRKGL